MQAVLIERLMRTKTVRLEADGTDITLEVGGRVWRNSDGKRNMPSGEVFTGPIETSANGHVKFTVPSSVHGHEVSGGSDANPAEGYLCLESEGAPVEFKDIKIRELP